MQEVERRLAALLSADVAGFGRLMADDDVATLQTLRTYREEIARLVAGHRGRVVDAPGDNVLAEFASVVDATRAAFEIQATLADRNRALAPERRMHFRIGVNVGDVLVEGDRLYGDGVNIAAGLERLAEPGGLCLSGAAFEEVRGRLDAAFEDRGEHAIKHIPRPVRVYATPGTGGPRESRPSVHAFGDFELDEGLYELRRRGEPMKIEPKVFDLLRILVRHRDRVVSKDELLDLVWAGDHVTEAVVHRCVNQVRKLLAAGEAGRDAIQTVHGRGYRFVATMGEPGAAIPGPPSPDEVFVGRESALSELRESLDEALAGATRVFLLVGEPGIGKTRTAEEVAREARSRGARVYTGRCLESRGAPSFWPWVQILRALVAESPRAALARQLGSAAAQVAQLVPAVSDALGGLPEPVALPPEQERFRLLDGLSTFLGEAARTSPRVLILEDLHWADRPTLQLLEFAARELTSAPLLIVATLRDVERRRGDPLAQTVAELTRRPGCRRVLLQGFTRDEVVALLTATLERPPPESLVQALLERTEGNPFFIREALRLLSSRGMLELADLVSEWKVELPLGVREVVSQRLESLSAPCLDALGAGAVLGREFSLALLERVVDLPREALLEALDEAVHARVAAEVEGSLARYAFSHGLVRDVLYDDLAKPDRMRLHRRAGEALEALHAGDLDAHLGELAHHFHEAAPAGDAERAIDYAERAAVRANASRAYEDAAAHYRRAVRALELREPSVSERRLGLLLALGRAQMAAGDAESGREAYLSAAEVARALGDAEAFARAAIGCCGFALLIGPNPDEALAPLLEEALERLGDAPTPLRARVLGRLAHLPPTRDSWEGSRRTTAEALEIARASGDRAAICDAIRLRRESIALGSEAEERVALSRELVQLSEGMPSEFAVEGFDQDMQDLLMLGDAEGLVQRRAAMARLSDDARHPLFRWLKAKDDANRALLEGRFAEAEALMGEAVRRGNRLGIRWPVPVFLAQTFSLLRELGRLDELDQGLSAAGPIQDWASDIVPALGIAVSVERGHDDARPRFEALVAEGSGETLSLRGGILVEAEMSLACIRLGDARRAPLLARALEPHARLNVVLRGVNTYLGPVTRYLAGLAAVCGRESEALALYEDARERAARLGARPTVARIEVEWARALLRASGRGARAAHGRGRERLASGRATAAELGMVGLEREASRVSEGNH